MPSFRCIKHRWSTIRLRSTVWKETSHIRRRDGVHFPRFRDLQIYTRCHGAWNWHLLAPHRGYHPAFDLDQALLRRVFFLEDRNTYVSVAFHPMQAYAATLEFGRKSLLLDWRTSKLPRWLNTYPALWRCVCQHPLYLRHPWRIQNRTGIYRIARINLGLGKHKHTPYKLQDLRYLNIMYIIVNQLKKYNDAQSDVMPYAMSPMTSIISNLYPRTVIFYTPSSMKSWKP
jgi:hypothetical protein